MLKHLKNEEYNGRVFLLQKCNLVEYAIILSIN